jgi:adenylate kinase
MSKLGKNLVFLGAPGVGKGTFAVRAAPKLNVIHVSAGDLVRAEIKAGSPLGKAIAEANSKGQLVPDDIISKMVAGRLQKPDAKAGFILDGFPRNVAQASIVQQARFCGADTRGGQRRVLA